MIILIIINEDVVQFNREAIEYLKENIDNKLIFISDDNIADDINHHYQQGVRYFILYTLSQQILEIDDIISSKKDAVFISPTSTVLKLRGRHSNLYFVSAANNYLNPLITKISILDTCLVYDNEEDAFVDEVVHIFSTFNIPTFSINDPNISDQLASYYNITMVSTNRDIFENIAEALNDRQENHFIFSIELVPSETFEFPKNVVGFTAHFPKTTLVPQLHSYWNIVSKNPQFTYTYPSIGCLPFLVNVQGNLMDYVGDLKRLHLISNSRIETGLLRFSYLQFVGIKLRYNLTNSYIDKYQFRSKEAIWLISRDQDNKSKLLNIQFLKHYQLFQKFVFTDDFALSVKDYYDAGFRLFVLDGPSKMVEPVHRLVCLGNFKDALFICLRATTNRLRKAGSNFLFPILDDKTMVRYHLFIQSRATDDKSVTILGSSEMTDTNDYEKYLQRNHITYASLNQLEKIPAGTIIINALYDDSEFDHIYHFLLRNRRKFDKLRFYKINDDYISLEQLRMLRTINVDPESHINYYSCQAFYDTEYSREVLPLWVMPYTDFYDVGNVIVYFQ